MDFPRHMDFLAYGFLGIWIFSDMGSQAYGFIGIWVPRHVDV